MSRTDLADSIRERVMQANDALDEADGGLQPILETLIADLLALTESRYLDSEDVARIGGVSTETVRTYRWRRRRGTEHAFPEPDARGERGTPLWLKYRETEIGEWFEAARARQHAGRPRSRKAKSEYVSIVDHNLPSGERCHWSGVTATPPGDCPDGCETAET